MKKNKYSLLGALLFSFGVITLIFLKQIKVISIISTLLGIIFLSLGEKKEHPKIKQFKGKPPWKE